MSARNHSLTASVALACALSAPLPAYADEEPTDPQPTDPQPTDAQPTATSASATDRGTDRGPAEWGADGPYVFDLHLRFGGGGRLDAPPRYAAHDAGGLLLGVGAGLALSRHIAVGLAYEHLDIGSERSDVLPSGIVSIARALHSGWLDLKLYPWRSDDLGVYVTIGLGLTVQTADLNASLWLPEDPGNSVTFFCSGSDSPGFAFQGGAGFDAIIAPGVRFVLESGIANHRLSDDIIGECAPGAGTTTALAVRGGVGYAWDL